MLELDPEQRRAVQHGEGPLLVIAGPGSGKTRVITERIVHLLGEQSPGDRAGTVASGIAPENVLALTYTDKAADEMKRRVRRALPQLETLPFISTFHAFCLEALRQHHFERRLLDQIDMWIFLRRRMDRLELEFYRKLAEPGAFLHDLNDFFSRCQDELVEPEDFEAYVGKLEREHLASTLLSQTGRSRLTSESRPVLLAAPPNEFDIEELKKKRELERVFRRSRELVERAGCSSFGSLISETLRLWEREPDLLERTRAQYRYVLVDEFQDTNFAQVELLRRLIAPPCNVTAVGDDDQAIYRFRGASHGQFAMFDRIFPDHETVHLNRNYRSTRKILRAADAVISKNDRYASKKGLRTENPEGSQVCLVQSPDYVSEAAWVASEIERLTGRALTGAGRPKAGAAPARFGDIAVLYRSHHHRELLVKQLRQRQIPIVIRGLSILSTTILRDVVAYLNVIHSPHSNVSLTRVLLALRWRFPDDLALDIRRQAAKQRCSIWSAVQAMKRTLFAPELHKTGWPELESLAGEIRKVAGSASITALFDRLILRLRLTFPPGDPDQGYVAAFRKFLGDWEKKNRDGVLSAANDERASEEAHCETHNAVDDQPVERRGPPTLQEFMDYFRYFVEAGGLIEAPEENPGNAVQMMSVHAAKGLEFPVVFVLGVARQRFPHREERTVIEFPDELRKGPAPPDDIHLQEERRLFYVALTRARERLYISSVATRGRKPSLFVDDVLSDPVFAARDLERIEAPEIAEAAAPVREPPPWQTAASRPLSETGESTTPQLSLFDDVPPEPSAVHPDILGWASRLVLDGVSPLLILPNAPRPKLHLSASKIDLYRDCPLKFKFSYHYRIPTAPQATLTFGGLMHQCVRYYFELRRRGLPRFDDLRDYYQRAWKDVGFEDEYQARSYQRSGLCQLQEFFERQNSQILDVEHAEFERAFTLELEDVVLSGRIDQINLLTPATPETGNGSAPRPAEVELVDYKTGKPRSQKDADKSLQLSVYALAARRMLGVEPVRLTFYNLTSNEPISSIRTQKNLERAVSEIQEVAARIQEQCFKPTPGFVCRRCEYVPLCPAHEEQ